MSGVSITTRETKTGMDMGHAERTSNVTSDDIRDALFNEPRPVVKPLFTPDRPVGVRFEHEVEKRISIVQRIIRFFDR